MVKEAGRMAWYFNDNYPWIGMLFCAPVIGLWYWCTDQYIVQRVLSAQDEKDARRGSIAAASRFTVACQACGCMSRVEMS